VMTGVESFSVLHLYFPLPLVRRGYHCWHYADIILDLVLSLM
jgi:hypothetical protein